MVTSMRMSIFALLCGSVFLVCGPKPVPQEEKKPVVESLSPLEQDLLSSGVKMYDLPKKRTQEELASAVAAHMGGIKYCYQKNIDKVGKGKGQVIVEFIIRTDGSVTDVAVIETFADVPEFLTCVKAAVKRWRFDRIADDGEEPKIFYPFEFGY